MTDSYGIAKRAVAGISVVVVLLAQLLIAPIASASSFPDVPANHWASEMINMIVDSGVMAGDPSGNFRPNDTLNRAEMAKIAVKVGAIMGVIEDETDIAGAPSFVDVSPSTWYYTYVAVAAKNLIVEGYRDATGNLTGRFGPGDIVNRAQAAKVLIKAGGVPEALTPAAPFLDVNYSDWFYSFVTSAYNWSVLDGYKDAAGNLTGYFGPADPVTRAQIAKIALLSQSPIDRITGQTPAEINGGTDTGAIIPPVTDTGTTVSTNTFEAAYNSTTPVGNTLASGTAYNTVLKVDLTAGSSEDVKVTQVIVNHKGISADSTVNGVLIVDQDGKRHGNIVTFSDSKATLNLSSDPIIVKAGSVHTVAVQINFNATLANSGTFRAEIPANGITAVGATSGGAVTVSGTFPISGPEYSLVSGTNIGNVKVDVQAIVTGTANNVDLGVKNKEITKFKFTQVNSQEDITVNELKLFNNGNSNDGDITNIKLVDPSGNVLATVASTTSRYVTFDLSAHPYLIPKGSSRTLSVQVDVVSGSTRTIQFVMENDYDAKIKGTTSQAFLLPTAEAVTDLNFPIGDTRSASDSATLNQFTINEGTLTVSKSTTSPSGDISTGGSDVVVAEFKVEAAGEDIEIQGGSVALGVYNASNALQAAAVARANLKGTFKITASGTTIHSMSATDSANDTYLDGTVASISRFNSYYTVKAGTTAIIQYSVGIADAATSGFKVQGSIKDLVIKKLSSNRTGSAAGTQVDGNLMNITTAAMTVSKNTAFGDQNVVKGAITQKVGSFNLTTTASEGVSINSMNISLTGAGWATATHGLTNLKVYNGTTQLGSTIATPVGSVATPSTTNSISMSSLVIPKSSNVTLDVYVDISSSSALTSLQVTVPASGISAIGTTSSTSLVNIPSVDAALQTNTISSNGVVTLSSTSSTAANKVLHANETGVDLFTFSVKADNKENILLQKVKVAIANGAETVSNLSLYNGDTLLAGPLTLTNGTAEFSGFSVTITKSSTLNLTVKGTVNGTGSLDSDTEVIGGVYYYEVRGASSGTLVQRYAGTEVVGTDTAENYSKGDAIVAYDTGANGALALVSTAGNGGTAGTAAFMRAAAVDLNDAGDIISTMPTTSTENHLNTVVASSNYIKGEVVLFTLNIGTTAPVLGIISTSGTAGAERVSRAAIAAAPLTAAAGGSLISKLPIKSIETVGTDSRYDYQAGEVVFINHADDDAGGAHVAEALLGIVKVAGTTAAGLEISIGGAVPRTLTVAGGTILAGDVITTLPIIQAEAIISGAQPAKTYAVGDIVAYNNNLGTNATTMGVVTAVNATTNALTIATDGAITGIVAWGAGGGAIAKLAGVRGIGKSMIVEDVEPVISLSGSSPSGTHTTNSADVVATYTIIADGAKDMTINSMIFNSGGSFNATTGGYVKNLRLALGGTSNVIATGTNAASTGANGYTCAGYVGFITGASAGTEAGCTSNGGTNATNASFSTQAITFTPAGGIVISAGQPVTLYVLADTTNVRVYAGTNSPSFGLTLNGSSAKRDINNSISYTYTNGKANAVTITTNFVDAYPLSSGTLSYN